MGHGSLSHWTSWFSNGHNWCRGQICAKASLARTATCSLSRSHKSPHWPPNQILALTGEIYPRAELKMDALWIWMALKPTVTLSCQDWTKACISCPYSFPGIRKGSCIALLDWLRVKMCSWVSSASDDIVLHDYRRPRSFMQMLNGNGVES